MNLNPYPKYKDSGVPWLGEVPQDWEMHKGKHLFNKMDRAVNSSDDVVTCFRDGVVTLRKNRRLRGFTESLKEIGYQGIRKGDLVIHQMDAFAGAVGVSDSDGKGTPVYSVCQPKINGISTKYYASIVKEMARTEFILSLAKGIRERSTDFRFVTFANLLLPFPSLPEQTQIARFLDWKTMQIAKFIKAKKRMIELLKEQKQVIINDAVTGKIDVSTGKPYPKYKDSGVEWLGQVPDEWEVRKLKHTIIGKLQYGANSSGVEYSDNLPRYIRITDFNKDGTLDEQKKLSLTKVSAMGYYLKEGDILFARSGATVGKAFQCKNLKQTSCFAGYLIKAEPNPSIILSDFVYLYAQSFIFIKWKNYNFIKATIENIGADKYSQLLIPIPIKKIQSQIITFIETKTAAIDLTISRTEREIALMQEYRDRLIADVVTGKIDVRNIPVPEEIEEILLDEEIEAEDLEEMEEVEE